MEVHERMLRSIPGYIEARASSETRAFQYEKGLIAAQRTGVTVIPVVVHIVWQTADQNISDAQIQSQIDVLNHDYRKANPDITSLPAVFQPLAADAGIEFVLATTDPNGAAANGITRTQTTADSFVDDNKVKSAATGGADAWDSSRYLNFWVCELGNGLLGYAQFPGGPAATDGVVILNSAFGTIGTAAAFAPFNHGRTASHEVGHWLNLRHIWGDDGGGCTGDDLVADTPNAAGPNFGKPTFPHVTCDNGPNGDLFMNYMDYTDDNSMFMFTAGQVSRMQACLDGDRSSIGHTKAGWLCLETAISLLKAADHHKKVKIIWGTKSAILRDLLRSLDYTDTKSSPSFAIFSGGDKYMAQPHSTLVTDLLKGGDAASRVTEGDPSAITKSDLIALAWGNVTPRVAAVTVSDLKKVTDALTHTYQSDARLPNTNSCCCCCPCCCCAAAATDPIGRDQ